MINKKKFFLITTAPQSLAFFSGQACQWKEYYDVTAISEEHDGLLEKFGNNEGVRTKRIPMHREISLTRDLSCLLKFIWLFAKQRPYIVHGNTPKGSLLSMIAAWVTRRPVRIYMCHGLRYQGAKGKMKIILMMMERISCHCATHVICVSKGVSQVLIEDKITNKKPIVVWNGSVSGIDINKFNPNKEYDKEELRKKYSLTEYNFVLTFVGRLVQDKGINELVEAFSVLSRKYPAMKLLLIGKTEMLGNPISIKNQLEINNNPAIIAAGPQYYVPNFLSITDIFVFPSYREGFGLSLMEAGAMGVPAVSTDIIGCNEVIEEGKTGLLIPSHSIQAIIDAVEKLYIDKDLYKFIKSHSRKSIVDRYEQKKLQYRYLEFYKGLLKG